MNTLSRIDIMNHDLAMERATDRAIEEDSLRPIKHTLRTDTDELRDIIDGLEVLLATGTLSAIRLSRIQRERERLSGIYHDLIGKGSHGG